MWLVSVFFLWLKFCGCVFCGGFLCFCLGVCFVFGSFLFIEMFFIVSVCSGWLGVLGVGGWVGGVVVVFLGDCFMCLGVFLGGFRFWVSWFCVLLGLFCFGVCCSFCLDCVLCSLFWCFWVFGVSLSLAVFGLFFAFFCCFLVLCLFVVVGLGVLLVSWFLFVLFVWLVFLCLCAWCGFVLVFLLFVLFLSLGLCCFLLVCFWFIGSVWLCGSGWWVGGFGWVGSFVLSCFCGFVLMFLVWDGWCCFRGSFVVV